MNAAREMTRARAIGAITWKLVRLPIIYALVISEPILRIGLTTIGVLGIVSAVVIELSGSAPNFPFWAALLFFGCCIFYPVLHLAFLRILAAR